MTTPEERIRAATAGEPVGGCAVPLPKPPDPEYVTIDEATQLTGAARRTIMLWLARGLIQRFKAPNGYNTLINKAELLSYERARRTTRSGRAPVVIDGEPIRD
jgi:hypothetical protein